MNAKRPVVATVIGDPSGIGPEIVAKAWSKGRVHQTSRPVLIGCIESINAAVQQNNLGLKVRKVESVDELADSSSIIDVLDTGLLNPDSIVVGQSTAACGKASAAWLEQAKKMYDRGEIAAITLAPIDTVAMKMAGVLEQLVPTVPGNTYIMLVSGPLRIAHVTDHIPLRDVGHLLTIDLVEKAITVFDEALRKWGISNPLIGVSGFNPHAMGKEEDEQIAPAVTRAKAKGMNVVGPVSPDAVFRHCIDGHYDAVLAMYHDQGHIAVKTSNFSGNCVVELGSQHLLLSVGHGVAYDIVGQGVADFRMMESAMVTAGSFASGGRFPCDTFG
ncbi:MAG: 4-hydroxythreonine-4-phosphate dehydrogenase PdxA [Porticoccaceae bacterium]